MKHYFITNPAAGKKNSCEILSESIEKACRDKNVDFEIYKTTGVGDATDFVKKTCEANEKGDDLRFYACGGDGTLCEVASGAVGFPFAAVGLIPKGTGNDFVRNFTDKEGFFDFIRQLDATEELLDVLKCNDMYAVNMVNIGFDCEVVKKMMKIKRSPLVPSKLAYIFGLLLTFIKKPGVKTKISINGSEQTDNSLLLTTVANGCYCGGGFHSNPLALLTDGKINTLFVNYIGRLRFLGLVSSYKKGTHLVSKNEGILSHGTFDSIDFTFDGMQSISVDGEIREVDKKLHIEAIRGGLRFLVPSGCSLIKKIKKEAEEALA